MIKFRNGRMMEVDGPVMGRDIEERAGIGPGRIATAIGDGGRVKAINPDKLYRPEELKTRSGKWLRIEDSPDRSKGAGYSFGGHRDEFMKAVIFDQIRDMSENFFKNTAIQADEDDANWMMIENFLLPSAWRHIASSSDLLISIPDQFPNLPPIGFYLDSRIATSPNGLHLLDQGYYEADQTPVRSGRWKWFCCYVKPSSWRPPRIRRVEDWRNGDNLWQFLTLIRWALGDPS